MPVISILYECHIKFPTFDSCKLLCSNRTNKSSSQLLNATAVSKYVILRTFVRANKYDYCDVLVDGSRRSPSDMYGSITTLNQPDHHSLFTYVLL